MASLQSFQPALDAVRQTWAEHAWLLCSSAVAVYLILVASLRYRNVRKLKSNYAQYLKDPHAMDYKTAHQILKTTFHYGKASP
jgi:hypothetical protein